MDLDTAYLILLLITNFATFYISKSIAIKQTLDFLEQNGHLDFDDDIDH